jgi:hypothetical protein
VGVFQGFGKNYNESEIYFLVFTVLLVLDVLVEEVTFELFELLLVRTVVFDLVSLLGAGLLGFTAGFASFLAGAGFAVLCAVGVAAL